MTTMLLCGGSPSLPLLKVKVLPARPLARRKLRHADAGLMMRMPCHDSRPCLSWHVLTLPLLLLAAACLVDHAAR